MKHKFKKRPDLVPNAPKLITFKLFLERVNQQITCHLSCQLYTDDQMRKLNFFLKIERYIQPFTCCGKFAIAPRDVPLPNSLPFIVLLPLFNYRFTKLLARIALDMVNIHGKFGGDTNHNRRGRSNQFPSPGMLILLILQFRFLLQTDNRSSRCCPIFNCRITKLLVHNA
jgi:hypothetical protein